MLAARSRLFGGILAALAWASGCADEASSASQQAVGAAAGGTESTAPPPDPVVPKAELGYIEVPAQKTAAKYAARMFYSFRAANDKPHQKPLFVMFNGGPGAATSSGLLPFGTGPVTIDPDGPEASPLRDNAASLTAHANLLYIDERQTGFSYGLGAAPNDACAMNGFEDAADFVRVLLEFLKSHDYLSKNPVAIVGESYGGARAILMEHLLLFPDSPRAVDTGIGDLITQHHARASAPGVSASPEGRAKQFGHLVLIQPLVVGKLQLEHQYEYLSSNPDIPPRFENRGDVRKPANYDTAVLLPRLLNVLGSKEQSARLFGVNLDETTGIKPEARKDAFRVAPRFLEPTVESPMHKASETNFAAWLGPLDAGDHYYHDLGGACPWTPSNVEPGNQFLQVLPFAKAFITNARYDTLIYTPAIPEIMKKYAGLDVTIDAAAGGGPRPGAISVGLVDGTRAAIRFPRYDAGHMVTVTQGAEFAADLVEWLK